MKELKLAKGQVWADKKNNGRSVKIIRVEDDIAVCLVVTTAGGDLEDNADEVPIDHVDFVNQYNMLHDPDAKPIEKPKVPRSRVTEVMEEWFAKNPIRKWLFENPTSLPALAGMVGVSVNTIHSWLRGANPKSENVDNLAAAIGMTREEFDKAWITWLGKKPNPFGG